MSRPLPLLCLAGLLVGCFDPSDVEGTESGTGQGTGPDAPTTTATLEGDLENVNLEIEVLVP